MTGRRQRGFTLIELMIAMVIASVVVILLLAIFSRISFAYREQQRVVGIQQVLTAARSALETDAKQAGLLMGQGFKVALDYSIGNVVKRAPVRIVNNAAGPDEVGFYYADLDKHAQVLGPGSQPTAAPAPTPVTLTIDLDPGFVQGELVVLSTPVALDNPVDAAAAKVMNYDACILEIEDVTGTVLTFTQSGNWGRTNNDHCGTPNETSTVSKLVARYWRIDTAITPSLGRLQLDPTGALLGIVDGNFTDQAYGIVDLQVATYFFDGDGVDTNDPDTDPDRDWESSEQQETYTNSVAIANTWYVPQPLMMTFSLVARTHMEVEGVFTTSTPQLTVAANTDNNTIGDRAAVALPSASDPLLGGKRIYRHVTFRTDLRNMGVGR